MRVVQHNNMLFGLVVIVIGLFINYYYFFTPKHCNRIVCSTFPLLRIGNSFIEYVDTFKYLGHFITNDLSDVADIQH